MIIVRKPENNKYRAGFIVLNFPAKSMLLFRQEAILFKKNTKLPININAVKIENENK